MVYVKMEFNTYFILIYNIFFFEDKVGKFEAAYTVNSVSQEAPELKILRVGPWEKY